MIVDSHGNKVSPVFYPFFLIGANIYTKHMPDGKYIDISIAIGIGVTAAVLGGVYYVIGGVYYFVKK